MENLRKIKLEQIIICALIIAATVTNIFIYGIPLY